ncbi:hypothetical protein ASF57_12660 [Methylobacterium sp. Leaf117]|nr:hypothetical protein ASF57_12660 [Methylobacterium sp. Leaf117]
MCLPADMHARVLRSTLEALVDTIRQADLTSAQASQLTAIVEDARQSAIELEETLRPGPPAVRAPIPPRPSRRFVGHSEPGSNVIALRAG